ncbi:MAG: hypothetical protein ACO1QB_04355 [Verrucomicrobiales bacterium]
MNNTNDHFLSGLTRSGVFLNVRVRSWRGQEKLKPKDIGLDWDNLSDRLVSLGQTFITQGRHSRADIDRRSRTCSVFFQHIPIPERSGTFHAQWGEFQKL